MKRALLLVVSLLSVTGYSSIAQLGRAVPEERVSAACALAISAALGDYRTWYAESRTGDSLTFERFLDSQHLAVTCNQMEKNQIAVSVGSAAGRGGGVWYVVEVGSYTVVRRVLGR